MNGSELNRPDPDRLLSRLKKDESVNKEGKLKIFFGMCAGVGKTFTMLEAAQKAQREGTDIVVGIVETHKRAETQSLAEGLEMIRLKEINYRGTYFKEMDLDGILARKPSLVLVDELAHTNIPGSRHVKRFQDVEELLKNGIDVYTTLNVQHLESRAETVQRITGTAVRETVPDSIFDRADEVELVDITIDALLQRLREGKVYTPEKSRQAIENFFRKGNLNALREMALRLTAERVDKELKDYKLEKNIYAVWKSGQRLMVAVGPSPYSANLIRWTRRLAYSLEVPWIAVYVETDAGMPDKGKALVQNNLKLAKELGAEVIITQDTDIISALVRVAKENNIAQIIVGKSRKNKLLGFSYYSGFVKKLIKESGDTDVYVVGGEDLSGAYPDANPKFRFQSSLSKYFTAALLVTFLTIAFFPLRESIGYQTVALLFLLTVSVLPLFNFGPGPILTAALLSAISWDFYFIPPQFTLHIAKIEDVLTLIMYFIVALVTGLLTSKIRRQQIFLAQKEERTSALFNLSKELTSAVSLDDIADVAVKKIGLFFNSDTVIIFSGENNQLNAKPHSSGSFQIDDADWMIANWVFKNGAKAGRYTNTLPLSPATFYPIKTKSGHLGVIGIKIKNDSPLTFEQENFLETVMLQIANAVEREYLNALAKKSLVAHESEKLYKTMFNSLSHELKTPITTIMGAVSSFKDENIFQNKNIWGKILGEINIAAGRLNRLVENLLDMARLESGHISTKSDWHSVSDLLISVLERFKDDTVNHKILLNIREDIPVFKFDFGLMEQALINIVHNSVEYTQEGSEIKIDAEIINDRCVITVADNGPGFSEDTLSKLFEKFYRIPGTKAGGTGLGLSIAKGFIEAHGGSVTASNLGEGGAVFTVTLPILSA